MKNLALKRIQRMKQYEPPLEGRTKYGGLLLDFNERTAPVSKKIIQALKKSLKSGKLQMYPEYLLGLEKKIAEYADVDPKQVMLTNGSNQGIDIIFRTFTEKGDKVIIPSPSFAMFFQYAQVAGNEIISPLYKKENLSFPLEEILGLIDEKVNPVRNFRNKVSSNALEDKISNGVKLLVVCNPNNPTGAAISLADIEKIAKKAKNAIIYIDEAYFEFSKITAVPLFKKYPNIIISRTFSKAFGLAGLRIGYVLAAKNHIAEMLKVRGPYDINILACCAACAALKDRKSMENYVEEVMKRAKPIVEKFFTENKIFYYPSAANFILFQPDNYKTAFEKLKKAGVLIRPQNKKNIEGTLRVSIGTVAQMKKFVKIYKKEIIKTF